VLQNLPIGFDVLRPQMLWLLVLVPAMFAVWLLWRPPLTRTRSRIALGLRLLLVALLIFALAGVRLNTQPNKRALIAVVDVSASTRSSLDGEAAAVRSLAAAKGPDDLFGVVTFGHDAAVEMPPTRDPQFDVFQTQPDPNYTDIAGALRLAAGLVPQGYARHLVLISDGRQNLGDAAAAVAALRAQGVRVDTYPVGEAPAAEALVLGVDAPSQMREGQKPSVTVRLRSTVPASGTLVLLVDGREVQATPIDLPAGVSNRTFELDPLEVGLHRVRVDLNVKPDTFSQNNVGEAGIRVVGRPNVLILEGQQGHGANVQASLEAAGMRVERMLVSRAPVDTASLGRYDATVVVDAPADAFPKDAMGAIAASVHDLGRGLVTIGGPTSYGPGSWQGTPLEAALPVRMDLPNRKEKPKVAVVLVMETMEDARADQIALSAAEAVIDKLSPDDLVGVTDGRSGWLVPITPVSKKAEINAKLESGSLGDVPSYLPFITLAGDALHKTDAPLKHIVLLGDGDADGARLSAELQAKLQALLNEGITTSAIGIDVHNSPPSMTYMQDVARLGGGRFYQSNNPSKVPDLFLKESQVALKPWFEQEPFFPKVTAAGDLLQGVPLDAFPQLGGYVVTTAKPGSELYLSSQKQDPVLAAWNYGLGRSVAWTSDAHGQWTSGFLRSSVSGVLMARMVAWTLPGSEQKLTIEATPSGDGLDVTVTGPEVSGASLQLGMERPDLTGTTINLVPTRPGRWQGRVTGASVGTYLLHARLVKGGTNLGDGDVVVSVPYSPEFLELGPDAGLLRQLSRQGSGVVLAKAQAAWLQKPLPVPISSDIFWYLLVAVALLWPLDVAIRRLILGPRQLARAMVSVLTLRRPAEIEVAAPPELVRLRRRVAGYRTRPAEPPPVVAAAAEVPADAEPALVDGAQDRQAKDRREEDDLSARLLEARRKRRGNG
jgi:uncharacterized membrane protein/Mg-chelatase subunit ChlD